MNIDWKMETYEEPKVSIIIPLFNASLYLERCVRSLFEQSLRQIEFIFINDCSTDDSLDVLDKLIEEYSDRRDLTKVISHSYNKGSASSRNTGLQYATGKFVGWVDADDWVEKEMFQSLCELAENLDADLVWCEFYLEFENKQYVDNQAIDEDTKSYMLALIQNRMQGMLWNKIIKREILQQNKLQFIDGCNMAEDRTFLFKVLHYSNKIVKLAEAFYHYVQFSTSSMTRDIRSERIYEEIENIKDIVYFISIKNIDFISDNDLAHFKFNGKRRLLLSKNLDDFKKWNLIFPDTNSLLFESSLSNRHKILAFFSNREMWFPVKSWIFLKKRMLEITN